jgi:hypothetical protein
MAAGNIGGISFGSGGMITDDKAWSEWTGLACDADDIVTQPRALTILPPRAMPILGVLCTWDARTHCWRGGDVVDGDAFSLAAFTGWQESSAVLTVRGVSPISGRGRTLEDAATHARSQLAMAVLLSVYADALAAVTVAL